MLAGNHGRQLAVVAARQVAPDLDNLRRDQVEVVEEPLGRRRDERAVADVVDEGPVGALQDALVVAQAWVDAVRPPPPWVEVEIDGQRKRPLFEPLGAERFFAKGLIAGPAVGREEPSDQVTLPSKNGANPAANYGSP
jgi:hypothetical protein